MLGRVSRNWTTDMLLVRRKTTVTLERSLTIKTVSQDLRNGDLIEIKRCFSGVC